MVFFPFDSLPAFLKEEVFLHLTTAELGVCHLVSSAWNDFVVNSVKQSKSYLAYWEEAVVVPRRNTIRRAFGEVVDEGPQVELDDTLFLMASCDESEQMLYILTNPPDLFDDDLSWPLKKYSCSKDGLRELNSLTLRTSHFITNIQIVAGHLVLFKKPKEKSVFGNDPAVFSLSSMPWGSHLSIESGIPLPGDLYHFSKLLLARDCLYTVSKNTHVAWAHTQLGNFREKTCEDYEDPLSRPLVVHQLTRQSDTWQEVARLHPAHEFRVMETFSHLPSKVPHSAYNDQTCLLHLSNDVITERYILVSCPLHGSYQLMDHVHGVSMWQWNTAKLSFENMWSFLLDSKTNSSHVLAAIRRDYIFIYSKPGEATLVSVQEGKPVHQVKGHRFALSPRFVLTIAEPPGSRRSVDVAVVDSVSGKSSPTLKYPYSALPTAGEQSWSDDDIAYKHFYGIAKQLLASGVTRWPCFLLKSESHCGYGYAMLSPSRMVRWWTRLMPNRIRLGVASLQIDEDKALDIERKLTLKQ